MKRRSAANSRTGWLHYGNRPQHPGFAAIRLGHWPRYRSAPRLLRHRHPRFGGRNGRNTRSSHLPNHPAKAHSSSACRTRAAGHTFHRCRRPGSRHRLRPALARLHSGRRRHRCRRSGRGASALRASSLPLNSRPRSPADPDESSDGKYYRVPKRDLVVGLQVLVEQSDFEITSGSPAAEALVKELVAFKATRSSQRQSPLQGSRDDLTMALARLVVDAQNAPRAFRIQSPCEAMELCRHIIQPGTPIMTRRETIAGLAAAPYIRTQTRNVRRPKRRHVHD